MRKLSSPFGAVIGTTDMNASIRFFGVFGLEVVGTGELPVDAARALYGTDDATGYADLATPGVETGAVRLVGTDRPSGGLRAAGGYTLDIYTRDLEAVADEVRAAGATASPVADYDLGPLRMREQRFEGPGGVRAVGLDASKRRPTALDRDPLRRCSEVTAYVFLSAAVAGEVVHWTEAGLTTLRDEALDSPEVGPLMGLDPGELPVHLGLLDDGAAGPRLELLNPLGTDLAAPPERLRAGLYAVRFEAPVPSGGVDMGDARVASGVSPGGVRYELWDRRIS